MALGGEGSGYSPSWDVEVVPALRKRLESESKSLARRISAVSLPSGDESLPNPSLNLPPQKPTSSLAGPSQHHRAATPSSNPASRTKPPLSLTPRPTTGNPSRKYHRARTYSSPYASDRDYPDTPPSLPMGGDHKSKQRKLSTDNNSRPPPTRIPKAQRPPTSASTSTSPQTQSQPNGATSYPNTPNGVATNSYRHNTPNSSYSHTVTPTPAFPDPYRQTSLDYPRSTLASAPASTSRRGLGIGISPSTSGSSRSTFDLPRGSFGFSRNFTTGSSFGLMNETPPFPTETSISSALSSSRYNHTQGKKAEEKKRAAQHEPQQPQQPQDKDPRRPSIDSEERPYEHWYRGEVSRNGGVGELKVGKRQEMLDIANYGHMIRSRDRNRGSRKPQPLGYGVTYEDGYERRGHQVQHPSGDWTTERGQRKRAGSVAGLTHKERERGSLYLDDDEEEIGERVMDQEPLTDLDVDMEGDEGPEEGVLEPQKVRAGGGPVQDHDKARIEVDPEDAEEFVVVDSMTPGFGGRGGMLQSTAPTQKSMMTPMPTSAPPQMQQQTPTMAANRSATPTAMMANNRSTTPTSTSTAGRPSNSIPRTRIPSRKSSDSRSTVASAAAAVTAANNTTSGSRSSSGGTTGTPQRAAAATTMTTPSSSSSTSTTTTSAQKRGAPSPGMIVTPSKKARGTPNSNSSSAKVKSSSSSSKTPPPPPTAGSKKGKENKDNGNGKVDKRTSVAMYPAVEGGDELADAIPSWMEPVSEGNWDDVVLPVVARKKGLDGYYENTSGNLLQLQQQQLREKAKAVEPAPGTFGYDHSKYRPFKDDDDDDDDDGSPIDEFGVPSSSPTAPIPVDRPPKPQDPPPALRKPKEEEAAAVPQLTHYVMVDLDPGPKVHQMQMVVDEEEKAAGCCQCVVM